MLQLLDIEDWRKLLALGAGGIGFAALCYAYDWARQTFWPPAPPPPSPPREDKLDPSTMGDELEGVEGIGPVIAAVFRAQGIRSFDQLAIRTPDELRDILRAEDDEVFRIANPASWPFQAKLLRDGRFSDFLALAVALRGGAPRLEDIFGIGEATADALRGGDIASPRALADAEVSDIQRLLAKAGLGASQSDIELWKRQASALEKGDEVEYTRLAELSDGGPRNATKASGPGPGRTVEPRSPSPPPVASPGHTAYFICTAGPALLLLAVTLILGHRDETIETPPPTCPPPNACRPPPPPTDAILQRKFPASSNFAFDQAGLTDEGVARLDKFAAEVREHGRKHGMQPTLVVVVGHADRSGGSAHNQRLSERRATAVERKLLSDLGGDPEIFHAYGLGATRPDPTAGTREKCKAFQPGAQDYRNCLAPDRRVVVTVVF